MLAAQTTDLGLLVARVADGCVTFAPRISESLGGRACGFDRFAPLAAELHELHAVYRAGTRELHELRLRVAPRCERLRPLARASERIHLVASRDHDAIDEAGEHRRQRLGRDGQHRFVEQRESCVRLTEPHGGSARESAGERTQVLVGEAVADLYSTPRQNRNPLEVSGRVQAPDLRKKQVPAFRAVLAFYEPLRARQPAVRAPVLASDAHAYADEKCGARGEQLLARIEPRLVEALERAEGLLVAAREGGRPAKPLDVCGCERCMCVGSQESDVGVVPGARGIRRARAFEIGRLVGACGHSAGILAPA